VIRTKHHTIVVDTCAGNHKPRDESPAARSAPDISPTLITDVRLAGKLNGLEVAEAFRCTYPDMPVIYASGNVIENGRLVPRSVFVSKPFNEAELLETCDRLAGRPSRD
jgi:CheY-like chemotaxis protein